MTDLDDLYGVAGIRDKSLRWNALDGQGWRLESYDPTADEKVFILLDPGIQWTVDMLSRRRGIGKTGDGLFDMRLTAVGAPPPAIPDDSFRPAVAMAAWAEPYGIAEITTCAAVARTAIVSFWEVYKSFTEAAQGLIPIVSFGPAREVAIGKRNVRSFWAPTFEIVGWADRAKVPGIQYRPATVLPPAPQNLQTPHLSARLKAHLEKPPVSEVINDTIPW